MTLLLPHRLTAWLCLALVLFSGLTPAEGFVVCIEDDGCVSIEVKATDPNCDGCEGHDEADTLVRATANSSEYAPCPCLDLEVPRSPERLAQSLGNEVHVGPWIAPPPEVRVQHASPTLSVGCGPPACIPRVSDSLAHIRTVVLLV
ncbi:MAG: hypothetical protein IT459_13120 [Planctomycetes bacterium]|nr:hypothetical protein [Planctomycetota bacterium]